MTEFAKIQIDHDDYVRSAEIALPVSNSPNMLILALHGTGSDAQGMAEFCQLHPAATKRNAIVVYPNGLGRTPISRSWNAGDCCSYAKKIDAHDVGFLDALIDRVFAEFDIDPNIRVCATGISAGGMMAYRFACESVRQVSAVCSVAGPAVLRPLVPRYPTPVLHFHGTDDEFTPYAGGVGAKSLSRIHFPSVEDTIAAWVAANGCDRRRTEELLQAPNAAYTVKRIDVHRYVRNTETFVTSYTMHGGGHTWPGQPCTMPFLGNACEWMDANRLMLDFFESWQ